MDIFQMSFAASILIAVIIIIRTIALYKLPKKIFLAFWGITILRLLVPFSIPSRFSVYTGLNRIKNMFAQEAASSSSTGMVASFSTNAAHMFNLGEVAATDIPIPTASHSAVETIWLAGMCMCALFFTVAYVRCRREFRTSLPVESSVTACQL